MMNSRTMSGPMARRAPGEPSKLRRVGSSHTTAMALERTAFAIAGAPLSQANVTKAPVCQGRPRSKSGPEIERFWARFIGRLVGVGLRLIAVRGVEGGWPYRNQRAALRFTSSVIVQRCRS